MNDEILITLVRDNPELYNLESKKYSDANHKEKVWISIGKELNTTGKWNQIMMMLVENVLFCSMVYNTTLHFKDYLYVV